MTRPRVPAPSIGTPLVFAAVLAAACAGPSLPGPVEPLSATPEAAFRAAPPTPGPEASFTLGPVETTRLENGLAVWVLRRPGWPRVSLRVATRHASTTAAPAQAGLARLVARIVEEVGAPVVNGNGDGDDLAREMPGRGILDGSPLVAGIGRRGTVVAVDATSRELPNAVRKLARAVRSPRISPARFEELRVAQLYGIRSQSYSASATALRLAMSGLFAPSHPYAISSVGRPEVIEAVSPEDAAAYHLGHYVPQGSALIAVGDVQPGEVEALARAHFGGWAPTAPAPPAPVPPPPTPATGEPPAITVADIGAGGEPVVVVAQLAPPAGSPDRPAFEVLAHVLGGAASSRLAHHLREDRGATYDASTSYEATPVAGVLLIRTDVAPPEVGPTLRAIEQEMRRLRADGITDEELQAATTGLRHEIRAAAGRTSGAASLLAEHFLDGGPPDGVEAVERRIGAVTRDEVLAVARRTLDPDGAQKVVAGFLRTYGPSLAAAGYHQLDVFRRAED